MNNTPNKLRRRDFLTGAITAIGSGALGAMPAIASAQLGLGSPVTTGPGLYFWTGTSFISADSMKPGIINEDTVGVRIEGFGASPNIARIDVQMPGGLFYAFTAQPKGLKVTQFTAPIATPLGLTLIVSSTTSRSRLSLQSSPGPGPKLALGTYLLVDSGVMAGSFILTESTSAPVVGADGQPVAIPYTLITLS